MILGFARHYKLILAAGLIATAGAFLGQGAAQAQTTYYPCSSINAAAALPANCAFLPTGGVGDPAINPITISASPSGVAGTAGTTGITIASDVLQVNSPTVIQTAIFGDRSIANIVASGVKVGRTDGTIANFTGLDVNGTRTILSGGSFTNPTQLTLNGTNATFGAATGAPITVTGVADGVNPFDAVNFRQLQAVSTGVASIAAMSNIPGLDPNKKFGIGIGYGNFQGNSALAVGINGRLAPSLTAKLSVGAGLSYGATSVGTGLSYSW